MIDSDLSDARFEAVRVPIVCAVDLHFESASAPTRLQAVNISMSGMYVRSSKMYEPGTVCTLSFELQDDESPIRGTAEVLWCRERERGPDQPKGIGIRFLELDLESKYAISRLVEQYVQLGELPFHLSGTGMKGGVFSAFRGRAPLFILLAFLAGLAIGSLGSLWLVRTPGDVTVELESTAANPRAFTASPDERSSPPGEADARVAPEDSAAVVASVYAWASAWSDKDVERYLACYSERFRPPSGLPLTTWQTQRRDRLARPGFIRVEISELEVEPAAAGRVIARFEQAFASPGYHDRVRKALELVWEGEAWKIVREETVAEGLIAGATAPRSE